MSSIESGLRLQIAALYFAIGLLSAAFVTGLSFLLFLAVVIVLPLAVRDVGLLWKRPVTPGVKPHD